MRRGLPKRALLPERTESEMGACAFEQNALVIIDGVERKLQRKITATLWQLEDTRNGCFDRFEHADLQRMYVDGSLVFPGSGKVSHCGPANLAITSQEHDVAVLRLAYVREALKVPNSRTSLERSILEVWNRIKIPAKAPGYITVYGWKRRYQASNCDYRVLVDNHRGKGYRKDRYPSDVMKICDQAIETKYMRRERNTYQKTLEDAQNRVKEANRLRLPGEALPLPTRRLIKRLVDKIPAYERHAARYGHDSARNVFRSVKGHIVTTEPLERAEIDHTQLDIEVVDDKTSALLGRPYVTACIDDFSRCILGIYVGFNSPSYQTVQLCLKDCLKPKVRLKEDHPEIQSEWPAHGVMRDLIVDGGLEFHGTSLEKACNSLGINIVISPRRTPWFKGKIERFLGTLNRAVTEGVPGTTFRSISEKGDYDSAKRACITLSTLKKNIMQWIADDYHQRLHRSIDTTPSEMWMSSVSPEDIRYPDESTQIDAVTGRAYQRSLTHNGIVFEGLLYYSPAIHELRRIEDANLKVEIRVNESDLGSIYVLWPKASKPFEVPAMELDYAKGLSLHTHKIIRRRQREGADIDQGSEGRMQVSRDISRRIEQDATLKRKRLGKRAGRYLEGSEKTKVHRELHAGTPIRSSTLLNVANGNSATAESYTQPVHLNGPVNEGTEDLSDDLPNFTARYKGGYEGE
jgi:putative transposase